MCCRSITAKYWFTHSTHTQHGRAYQITQKMGQKNEIRRKHTKTHTLLHSSWTIACTYWLCSHLWLFLCISRLKGMATDSSTQTHVINSITHTPVHADEAKTNPSLFMFCLRFNKKAFFFLSFFSSSGRLEKKCPCLTLFQWRRRSTWSSFSWANVPRAFLVIFFFLCLCNLSVSPMYSSFLLRKKGVNEQKIYFQPAILSFFNVIK